MFCIRGRGGVGGAAKAVQKNKWTAMWLQHAIKSDRSLLVSRVELIWYERWSARNLSEKTENEESLAWGRGAERGRLPLSHLVCIPICHLHYWLHYFVSLKSFFFKAQYTHNNIMHYELRQEACGGVGKSRQPPSPLRLFSLCHISRIKAKKGQISGTAWTIWRFWFVAWMLVELVLEEKKCRNHFGDYVKTCGKLDDSGEPKCKTEVLHKKHILKNASLCFVALCCILMGRVPFFRTSW